MAINPLSMISTAATTATNKKPATPAKKPAIAPFDISDILTNSRNDTINLNKALQGISSSKSKPKTTSTQPKDVIPKSKTTPKTEVSDNPFGNTISLSDALKGASDTPVNPYDAPLIKE